MDHRLHRKPLSRWFERRGPTASHAEQHRDPLQRLWYWAGNCLGESVIAGNSSQTHRVQCTRCVFFGITKPTSGRRIWPSTVLLSDKPPSRTAAASCRRRPMTNVVGLRAGKRPHCTQSVSAVHYSDAWQRNFQSARKKMRQYLFNYGCSEEYHRYISLAVQRCRPAYP